MARTLYPNPFLVLDAASALNAVSDVLHLPAAIAVAAYVTFSIGCTDGTVVLESSDVNPYTGTWVTEDSLPAGDNIKGRISANGPAEYWRVRVSEALVGGTVTVRFQALVDFTRRG